MRRIYLLLTLLVVFGFCGKIPAAEQPNFVVFLTDDQGWGDLGCYGHPLIQSPNLDKFATEGLRLTQCYSACSVCSPSRSAILTGRTPYRNGVWRWIPAGHQVHLRTSEITIAELLKDRGYSTCHAGKWHLNGHFNSDKQPQPNDHGYDHWLATQNNAAPNHLNPTNYVRNGKLVGRMEGASSGLAVAEAIAWLKQRKDQKTPFFLTVWTHEPHLPIESAPRFMEPYKDIKDEGIRQHHGNVTQLDHAFGTLMQALDDMKYRDNTFVMFTSDNGPEGDGKRGRTRGSTGGLRGRKRHTHEGGIRVPGLIRWPGKIQPGTVSDDPVIGSDIFTTICSIMNIPLPTDRTIDGADMTPLFAGKPIQRTQPLYWRNHLAQQQYRVGLRVGDWKIVGSDDLQQFELYNIKQDWQETTDLAAEQPEKFAELKQTLIKHDTAVLKEGPDWWKHEPPRKRKRKKTAALPRGKDDTGDFDVVKGTTVHKSDLGYHLETTGEGLALWKLKEPLAGRTTFSFRYRSTQKNSQTRNAALVLGRDPTNAATLKIGTAIGMGQHVAFTGGWVNVGTDAQVKAAFDPLKLFAATVTIDIEAKTIEAVIDGKKIAAKLPDALLPIRYFGYYTKATSSEFSPVKISRP